MSAGADGGSPRRGGMALLRRRRASSATAGVAEDDAIVAPLLPQRMRATLVVNPYSSGMTAKREREIVALLRDACDLEILRTERPGHATELAAQAAEDGVDLVVACGGDGTGNEVLNGLPIDDELAPHIPRFALIPAGGTNVLSRSVGLPNNPVAATHRIVEAIREDRSVVINLGRMDERLFMFAAGMGFDGEVMKIIDARRKGRRPSDLAHVRVMLGMFASERWRFDERMTIRLEDTGEELRACLLMVGNTTPMTYVGRMAMHFMPDCALDTGLDLIAPARQSAMAAIRNGARAMGVGRRGALQNEQIRHDVKAFTVTCDEPQPCQVDGDYVGDRTHVRFTSVERCVRYLY